MNKVLNFLTSSPPVEAVPKFVSLLEAIASTNMLVSHEPQMARFILDFYNSQAIFPSVGFVLQHFPSVIFQYETALSVNELTLYWQDILKRQSSLYVAQQLSALSEKMLVQQASPTGESFDIVKELSELQEVLYSPVRISVENNFSITTYLKSRENIKRMYLGIPQLDSVLGGLEPGTINIMAAFVGNMKTTASLSATMYNALKGNKVAYITLESSYQTLGIQLASCFTTSSLWEHNPIAYSSIMKNTLTTAERKLIPALDDSVSKIMQNISLVSQSSFAGNIAEQLPTIMRSYAEEGYSALFLDNTQLLATYAPNTKDYVRFVNSIIEKVGSTVVALAHRGYDFRVCLLSQIGREYYKAALESDPQGEYNLACLAQFNQIEKQADYVCALFLTDELKRVKRIQVQVLKNRTGDTCTTPVEEDANGAFACVGINDFSAMTSTKSALMTDGVRSYEEMSSDNFGLFV
jgi:replicative DNA helicase